MGMHFAILKEIKGDDTQVLEYDEAILSERIPKLVLEMLPLQTVFKRKYSREEIEMAAHAYEPHQLTYYLRDLAQDFHTFYDSHKILIDDNELRQARLSLIAACQQVLRNGLTIIGVSAPEVM